ncbi:MAG: hypothetical protein JSR90_16465 [Proteobacteria bacterium]|nr:hypothetical protein [Pseudomonadota bacterium]
MDYSDGYLRSVLPPEDPPRQFVPPAVEAEIASWIEGRSYEDAALVARSTRWTYALFQELQLGQAVTDGPFRFGSHHWAELTIGLYDRQTEKEGFGLALPVTPSARPAFEPVGEVAFPRLGRSFPLAFRQARIDEHAPPHPVGATAASWAQCNQTAAWGLLTAGHAVATAQPGQGVPLASRHAGTLGRSAYPIVDAAFVTVTPGPAAPAAMNVLRFPAAGQHAVVERQAGPAQRTVVSAMNTLGNANTRAFRILFLTDTPCAPGDSGALVRTPQGAAMGIYTGSFANPTSPGGLAGLNQNFEQAVLALDVTAYG